MGAMGAAVATVIGYFCSVLYFLWLLHKKSRCLSVKVSLCRVSGGELRQILGVGVTAALSNLMQSLWCHCGQPVPAALRQRQDRRHGRRAEMKKLVRFCLGSMSALSLVLTAVLYLFASPLMGAFVKDAAMIATGAEMLRW